MDSFVNQIEKLAVNYADDRIQNPAKILKDAKKVLNTAKSVGGLFKKKKRKNKSKGMVSNNSFLGANVNGKAMSLVPSPALPNRRFSNRNRRAFRRNVYNTSRRGGRGVQRLSMKALGTRVGNTNFSQRITHRELVADISCQEDYTPTATSFNPGLKSIVTWLPQIAGAFEKYKINSIHFEYIPSSGLTASGTFWLAYMYDPTEIANTEKYNSPNAIGNLDCESVPIIAGIGRKCNNSSLKGPSGDRFFIRQGAVPTGDNARWYDPFVLITATKGDDVVGCGRLYVCYDITFFDPVPNPVPLCSLLYYAGDLTEADPFNDLVEYSANPPVSCSGHVATLVCDFEGLLTIYAVGSGLGAAGFLWDVNITSSNNGSCTLFTLSYVSTTQQVHQYRIVGFEGDTLDFTYNTGSATQTWVMFTPISANFIVPALPPSLPANTIKNVSNRSRKAIQAYQTFHKLENVMRNIPKELKECNEEAKIDEGFYDRSLEERTRPASVPRTLRG